MEDLVLVTLVAFGAAVVLTPVVRRVALALDVVDRPDGLRKRHRAAVPLLGGVALFVAWGIGVVVAASLPEVMLPPELSPRDSVARELWPVLLLAAGAVLITGMLDDLVSLRPRWKLLGQAVAAALLVTGGTVVDRLSLFGYTVELGWLGIALTFVWLIGSMNAINLLDGLDGLASVVTLILCLALGGMAWLTPMPFLTQINCALAGALVGFLLYNLPPARIFLGDSGSMLIGLILGAVAIQGSCNAPVTIPLTAPILVMTLPIFDGVAAVIRRWCTGTGVFTPDRRHIHHCLQERGWSNWRILAFLGGLCLVNGSVALVSVYLRSELLAVLTAVAVVVFLVATKLFGHYEYVLLREQARAFWSVVRRGFRGMCQQL